MEMTIKLKLIPGRCKECFFHISNEGGKINCPADESGDFFCEKEGQKKWVIVKSEVKDD